MNTDTKQIKFFLNNDVRKALTSYLEAKKLNPKTTSKYLEFFEKFANVHGVLNQETLDEFLSIMIIVLLVQ